MKTAADNESRLRALIGIGVALSSELSLDALLQQCIEVALRRYAPATQGAKRAARFGYRALGVPQLVARFSAAFLGLRDFRAKAFDTRSEGIEPFPFALGERQDGYDEERHSDPDQGLALAWSATARVRASASAGSPR